MSNPFDMKQHFPTPKGFGDRVPMVTVRVANPVLEDCIDDLKAKLAKAVTFAETVSNVRSEMLWGEDYEYRAAIEKIEDLADDLLAELKGQQID